jgi:glycosyltransferase involved in cell wall biosynthesis
MISILIPVFNTEISGLVNSLSRQLSLLNREGEIIILDDASADHYKTVNRLSASSAGVEYHELANNLGRIRIRQALAEKARYPWLLFIDGDSTIISEHFLSEYYRQVEQGRDLINGGRIYDDKKPSKCNEMLHWKYGREREAIAGSNTSFHTNNFCIRKKIFDQLTFEAGWEGYGHEDTWMGIQLEQSGIRTLYINNPVLHKVLETSEVFLQKSLNALENLRVLVTLYENVLVRKHVRLLDTYYKLKTAGLLGLVVKINRLLKKPIEKNLESCNPSLKVFDLYRLSHFINLNRSSKN